MNEALWVIAGGIISLIIKGLFDARINRANARTIEAKARRVEAATSVQVQQVYQAIVDDMQVRLTAIEEEQTAAIAAHQETERQLLERIEELKALIVELKQRIERLTAELKQAEDDAEEIAQETHRKSSGQ